MDIHAILFDVNGTLIDIETDEGAEEIYSYLAHFLTYQGIGTSGNDLRELYFQLLHAQRAASAETYPEVDVVGAWRDALAQLAGPLTKAMAEAKLAQLPLFLAEMHRALSRRRLRRFPDVRRVLQELKPRYRLGVVTDGMSAYAVAELRAVGLGEMFAPIVVSGDRGIRKPDARLFRAALDGAAVRPENTVFVGNDLYYDIGGAREIGMRTIFFCSGRDQVDPFSTPADYVIYRFGELPEALRFLSGK